MFEPETQAAILFRCANHLEGLRDELLLCERQLQQETAISLWMGLTRREYDSAAHEVVSSASRLRHELVLLASEFRSHGSVMMASGYE